jgi:uncharacterized membrane-anchored protein YhcB (DUF1043 family)
MTAILGAVVGVIVGLAIGALLGYALRRNATRDQELEAQQQADRLLAEAQAKEKEILLGDNEEAINVRAQAVYLVKVRRD